MPPHRPDSARAPMPHRPVRAALAVGLLLLATATLGRAAGLTEDPSYLAASRAAQKGLFEEALRQARDLQRRFDTDPRVYFLIGMYQDQAGHKDEAVRTLEQLRARWPADPWGQRLQSALDGNALGTMGIPAGASQGAPAAPAPSPRAANAAAARPFEELHWAVRIDATPAGPRIGEARLDEGPAFPTSGGPFRLQLAGPVPAVLAEFSLGPGPMIVVETPTRKGHVKGRTIPVDSAQVWIGLPTRPNQGALLLVGPAGGGLDARPITQSLLWRALLALARPAPEAIPRSAAPSATAPPRGRSAAAGASGTPGSPRESPAGDGSPSRSLESPRATETAGPSGGADAGPDASLDPRWRQKLERLDQIVKGLESRPSDESTLKLRSLAELYLCPDLGRFADGEIGRIDPYINRQVALGSGLEAGALRQALHTWLATGDQKGLDAAWLPWRRHLADKPLWMDMSTITLCRLSRRVEGILAGGAHPGAAGQLLALEALLLLSRYEPVSR